MRGVHWLRAVLILGTFTVGIVMVNLPDDWPIKFEALYPNHKQFGVLAWIVGLVQMLIRAVSGGPAEPASLRAWERHLSRITHVALYALIVAVPLMGYAMSSSFAHSDGVPFFVGHLPELLPKSDRAFELFQRLHSLMAYALIALVVLHVAGALKHAIVDKDPEANVLRRMW